MGSTAVTDKKIMFATDEDTAVYGDAMVFGVFFRLLTQGTQADVHGSIRALRLLLRHQGLQAARFVMWVDKNLVGIQGEAPFPVAILDL